MAWDLDQEGKGRFSTHDTDLLEMLTECISGDLRGAIKDQDPKTGKAAIALLIKAAVYRPHPAYSNGSETRSSGQHRGDQVGCRVDQGGHSARISVVRGEVLAILHLQPRIRSSGGHVGKISAHRDQDIDVLAEVPGRDGRRCVQVPAVQVI